MNFPVWARCYFEKLGVKVTEYDAVIGNGRVLLHLDRYDGDYDQIEVSLDGDFKTNFMKAIKKLWHMRKEDLLRWASDLGLENEDEDEE